MKQTLFTTLFCILVATSLDAAPRQSTKGTVPEDQLKLVLKAIEDGVPYDQKIANNMGRILGRKGEMLSLTQCKKVWKLYDKFAKELEGQPRKARKLQPGEGIPRTFGDITMSRAFLFFTLFERMPAKQIKAVKVASAFPGMIKKAKGKSTLKLEVDTTETRWHSTGLYAAPGETIAVSTPKKWLPLNLSIRIGCHSDHTWQWYRNAKRRWPRISLKRKIKNLSTSVANPFGGLVYIEVPNDAPVNQKFTVTIKGGVKAPRFVLGETSPTKWKREIRNYRGLWAELECKKLVLTIPSELAKQVADPTEALIFWQKVADAQDDLSGRTPPRYKERMVVDVDISAGALHSGYPLMGHLNSGPVLVDINKLKQEGTWGWFHELGHNHQRRVWNKPGEVTVNIFSMYTMETVVGLKTENVKWYQKCIKAANKFYADGQPDISARTKKKAAEKGVNLSQKGAWETGTTLPLAMYIQLRKEFGWDFYKKVFREYEQVGAKNWPKKEEDKRDLWLEITSKNARRNLTPFYQRWGFTTSQAAQDKVKETQKWNPQTY